MLLKGGADRGCLMRLGPTGTAPFRVCLPLASFGFVSARLCAHRSGAFEPCRHHSVLDNRGREPVDLICAGCGPERAGELPALQKLLRSPPPRYGAAA